MKKSGRTMGRERNTSVQQRLREARRILKAIAADIPYTWGSFSFNRRRTLRRIRKAIALCKL